jgi:hypothetical protein
LLQTYRQFNPVFDLGKNTLQDKRLENYIRQKYPILSVETPNHPASQQPLMLSLSPTSPTIIPHPHNYNPSTTFNASSNHHISNTTNASSLHVTPSLASTSPLSRHFLAPPPQSSSLISASLASSLSPSALLLPSVSRKTMFYLLATLNAAFPDYDFR